MESKSENETFVFNADISQLMSLIINTFYSNKDIFLRELVSNASDALDKIRYNSLTNDKELETGKELKIEIIINKEEKTLTIQDTGIGMTKEDLINNLGTIAKSGTKAFMEKLSESGDISMIGQFGVGFYSAFLVANKVEVVSKNNNDSEYKWSSDANNSFIISSSNTGLTRGTKIILYMKDEQLELLEENKIKELVSRHSQFINFPLLLEVEKEIEEEVEVEEEDNDELDKELKDELESDDEDSDDSDKPTIEEINEEEKKTKTVKKTVREFERLNDTKPIWTCKTEDCKTEDYNLFYKSLTGDYEEPLYNTHFSIEGQLEFKSLLFIPSRAPNDMFDTAKKEGNVKLYVRRIFITDDCSELIPDWLKFLRGIVDSEDLPLNISRENLQQNKVLKVIKKNLVKKSLEMFKELSNDEEKYGKFYELYSKNIKLGVHSDLVNREKLANLLRYHSSKSGSKMTTLNDYISRMKEDEQNIYYIIGENRYVVENSPFLESLTSKNIEVLYMTETIDEYVVQQLTEYNGKKLINITKEELKLNKTEEEKKVLEKDKESFDPLCKKIKEILGEKVEKVVTSERMVSSPCCIVTSEYGWSANMERIMKAQALNDSSMTQYMKSKKILEINPKDQIILEIKNRYENNSGDKSIDSLVFILFETCIINSGFVLENPSHFTKRINNLVKLGLGLFEGQKENKKEDVKEDVKEYVKEEEEKEEMEKVD